MASKSPTRAELVFSVFALLLVSLALQFLLRSQVINFQKVDFQSISAIDASLKIIDSKLRMVNDKFDEAENLFRIDAPRFDVVRVSRDGMTVIAGRAPELAKVEIFENEAVLAEVEADRRGEWAVILDQPLGAGHHELRVRAYLPNGQVITNASITPIVVIGLNDDSNNNIVSSLTNRTRPARTASQRSPDTVDNSISSMPQPNLSASQLKNRSNGREQKKTIISTGKTETANELIQRIRISAIDSLGHPFEDTLGRAGNRDYSNADLSGADLNGENFRSTNLRGADLSGANLRNANLAYADLTGANLSNANLSQANLSVADLTDANLRGANLSSADLSLAYFKNSVLEGVDFSGAVLRLTSFQGAQMLTRAQISAACYMNQRIVSDVPEEWLKSILPCERPVR